MIIGFKRIPPQEHVKFFRTRVGINHAVVVKKDSRLNLTSVEAVTLFLNRIVGHPNVSPKIEGPVEESNIIMPDLSDVKGPFSAMQKIKDLLEKWEYQVTSIFYCEFEEGKDKEGATIDRYKSIKNLSYFRTAIYEEVFLNKPLLSTDKMFVEKDPQLETYPDGRFKPVNDLFKRKKFRIYGQHPFLQKAGKMMGTKSFVGIPVYDTANRIIGSINIGLEEKKLLSLEKLEILRKIAQKLGLIVFTENGFAPEIDEELIEGIVKSLNRIPQLFTSPIFLIGPFRTIVDLLVQLDKMISKLHDAYKIRNRQYFEMLQMLAYAVETRDPYTGGHCFSVERISRLIGEQLPEKEEWLPPQDINGKCDRGIERLLAMERIKLSLTALIHDLGKIGIDDEILRKRERLTGEEFEKMKEHTKMGAALLTKVEENPLIQRAVSVALSHHERFDGRGYPDRLSGKSIPLFARIVAVADSFHAMVSSRAYKEGKSYSEAVSEIFKCAGTQFDPIVVEAFLRAAERGLPAEDIWMEELRKLFQKNAESENDKEKIIYSPIIQSYIELLKRGESVQMVLERMTGDEDIDETLMKLLNELSQRVETNIEKVRKLVRDYLRLFELLNRRGVFRAIAEFSRCKDYNPKIIETFIGKLNETGDINEALKSTYSDLKARLAEAEFKSNAQSLGSFNELLRKKI